MTDSHNPALLPLLAPTNLDSFYCSAVESLFQVLVSNIIESHDEKSAQQKFENGLKIILRAYELASDVFVKYR